MAISEDVGTLDSSQQAAVAHGEGPALVLAGPGSGKTRVIVERAVRLIDEEAAQPEQLLVLTFSRKAASDLRERLADRLRRSYASFPVTTFHAFCFSLLAAHLPEPPKVATAAQQQQAMRSALASENNLDLEATSGLVTEALAFAALCDDYLVPPEHRLARVRARYVEILGETGSLDYGGLQRETIGLLQSDDELRRSIAEGFRYILVDEYQDTNVAQDALLALLAGERGNVFCVADEDQSIYGFRGAEIENALRFEERWPGATVYDLPTNYRSAPPIVELAKHVIRFNVETHRNKPLEAAGDGDATLTGRTFRHAAEETDWIAREIAALRLEGVELGQVAVLGRSLKEIGPRLAYALRRYGIAFHAPLSAPLHPTVEALLSLIELAGPERWDDQQGEQALDALGSPLFRADPLELRRFRRAGRTIYGALRDSGEFDPFFEALAIVKRQREPGTAVYALWERLGYFRELQERVREDALQEDVEELAAVTGLSDAANEFEGELSDFPTRFRAGELAAQDGLPPQALPSDAVALLTVHQAKGLEWDAVFVCDLVEGRFPALSRSSYELFEREDFTHRPLDEAGRAQRALEEERRLFYVAATRARSQLYLTATEESRQEAGRSLSRFYIEAQDHLDATDGRVEFASAEEAVAALRRAGGGPPGWRANPVTANDSPMLPAGGLYTSASALDPYDNCPLQFFYGTMLELVRPQGAALVFGGIVHDVLEEFHNPDGPPDRSLERLRAIAREKWRDGITPASWEDEYRRKLDRMLGEYHRLEIEDGADVDVLAVERYFRFGLDDSTISGRIDRIDRLSDGLLRLIDYKSGKAMSDKKAAEDLQLALYALACVEVPELAALGQVGEIEYLYPAAELAYGKLKRRSQPMTPELADATRQRVRDVITQVVAERFDFSPEAECKFCDFKPICPRWHGRDVPV